ncbi:hypothetical protein [Magnetospirillum aberrantis]|uniref:Transglutaminase domain-containing protein n=1 Tax=Magnetospirillum aberrantis SpK TaxID=908842 RepID=A0A7C9QVJ9_9PROT|nr:hypothetical protein [Magnetospirillum aberrantis]NFV81585.1 hypothetical protein [Magnetospirillum aberrantis SpK]
MSDGPYLSRTFILKNFVVAPDDPEVGELIANPEFVDHRGRRADFRKPLAEQLLLPLSDEETQRYRQFLDGYLAILDRHDGLDDRLAREITDYIYRQWRQNADLPYKDLSNWNNLPEHAQRFEDLTAYFVNSNSSCGTIGQTTSTLLRFAGFRTRTMLLSGQIPDVNAGHVFAEYYSPGLKKWVMVDAQQDFIPDNGHTLLSAFEFFPLRDRSEIFRRAGISRYDNDTDVVLHFTQRGPIAERYMLAWEPEVWEILARKWKE